MKYFNNVTNLGELKRIYHQLAKRYHPDANANGDNQTMAQINSEYKVMFEKLKKFNNESANANVNGFKFTDEAPDLLINVINELIKFNDIELEICGLWLWVSGDTKTHKEALKALGLKYSSNKHKWYYGTTPTKWHKGHKAWSMEKIRSHYGSELFQENKKDLIGA